MFKLDVIQSGGTSKMLGLDDLVRKMSAQGWRVTDQRKTLAQIFLDTQSYLTPREVYEKMGQHYRGLSYDTVYRNLRSMAEIGLIEQASIDYVVKFKLQCAEFHHHHHFICVKCEKTFPFVFCPMDAAPPIPHQFKVLSHKFEVYGLCKDCDEEPSIE